MNLDTNWNWVSLALIICGLNSSLLPAILQSVNALHQMYLRRRVLLKSESSSAHFTASSKLHLAPFPRRIIGMLTAALVSILAPLAATLPHVEELTPGVFAAGFAHRYDSANCGWIRMSDHTLLIDLPHGVSLPKFLEEVEATTGKPVQSFILTHPQPSNRELIDSLVKQGLRELPGSTGRRPIGDAVVPMEFIPYGTVTGSPGAAIYLTEPRVLFAGPLSVNGPRIKLPGSDTAGWVSALAELQKLPATRVVPGFGSWDGSTLLERQRLFLVELRRQIAYQITMGLPVEKIEKEITVSSTFSVWTPYDTPATEDIRYVHGELTIPAAPYSGRLPQKSDPQPHALVLIGDRPHEPEHIESGLRPVFAATGVVPHFLYDVRGLTAENLGPVRLLVILRDGFIWPEGKGVCWMTPEQEQAVVQFVEGGGALLNLHNSMGLYPENGPYLKLVGGRFKGHGPLERFRTEVVDAQHPITEGVVEFFTADEQHTPDYDTNRVHLLLRSRSDDGKTVSAAGWAHEPGKGRVCHLANGHTREALHHPVFQRLLRNAVNWCLRRAPAAVGGKDQVTPVVALKAEPFSLQAVRLLDGPFKHAMELDRKYLLSLDADRLLHVFRLSAGLPSTAKPYGGWMAPASNSRGEFVGLYLSACAEMYASTGDEQVKANADRVVAGLAQCQQKLGGGFLHTHPDLFTRRGEAPLPFWYQIHKVLAGLMDMYVYCDNRPALEIARQLADWARRGADGFSDAPMQKMLDIEHGGINEALANLYALTGDPKYLQLSLRMNHLAVIGPASQREDRLTGLHANTQIPKFVGTARQYELTGDESLRRASTFFWETVVNERSYVIGGHSLGEHFSPTEKLSQALGPSTCETCNTYNMLKLTRHLFFWEPRADYADYYERALYNHILASQHPVTGMMCYYVPLGSDPRCVKEYCTPEDSFWCCTGTGIENHAKYGDSIYFHQGETALFVNLFIASELNWQARGIRVRQETKYPEAGSTRLTFTCEKPVELSLRIRHPYWAVSGFEVRVNGVRQPDDSRPGSYALVARNWENGDTVEVSMPFTLRTEGFRDNPRRFAFLHGPLVLCAATESMGSNKSFYPIVTADENPLCSSLRPVPDRPSTFVGSPQVLRLSDEPGGRDVTLEPFYRLHGNRQYVVYWDALKPKEWQEAEEKQRQQRAIEARLAARTVDRVIPADEQNERAHKVQGEKTMTGEGRWRHATDGGWFSWEMKVLPDPPQELRVKYWGGDTGGREFDILIEGQKLATQKLDHNKPGEFYDETYRLPLQFTQGKERVTVRFQAHPGKLAGGVFGCAILRMEE